MKKFTTNEIFNKKTIERRILGRPKNIFSTEFQQHPFHHKKPQTESSKRSAEDSSNQPQRTKSKPFSEALSAVSTQHKTPTTIQIP